MIEFDFITDDRFRASLTADYAEFRTSLDGEAWKAALVLVGSMVEALLVDHLMSTDYQTRSGNDPLKMQLGELIAAGQKQKVLSATTAALSTVIQKYRNLIHPGRSVRLGETANKGGAVVAGELLQMIVDEISVIKRNQYGYTADQIVKKLERDESAMSIHKHLLKDVREHELGRLLISVIPNRYFELDYTGEVGEGDIEKQNRLAICFRSAFNMASVDTKKKVTKNFFSILKEEDQYKVFTYETAFFRAGDLKYLSLPEAKVVKDHLLSRLQTEISEELINAIDGLSHFVEPGDISGLIDSLVRAIVNEESGELKAAGRRCLLGLWGCLPNGDKGDAKVIARLGDWIAHYEKNGNLDSAEIVRKMKNEFENFPF
jgi:hypothetical protein